MTDPGPVGPAPRRGWRVWLRRCMIVVLLGFAVWAIVSNRHGLAEAVRQMQPWALGVTFVPAVGAMVVSLFVWRELMSDLGFRLPVPAAARIFFISQLGKYVPGSLWSILTQIELSRDHQIPKRTNVTVGALAIAVSITTGLSLGALLLPFAGAETIHRYWWIMLIIPVFLGILHPRILGPALNFGLRLIRREPLPRTPSWPGLSRVAGLQLVVWSMLGLQVWVLLLGLGVPAGRSLAVAIGGYALAYGLGQLAIGLPAGAGVREAALTAALSTVVSPAEALTVALLARGTLTVVDLSMAGLQYVIGVRARWATDADAA
ncbi:MAG: flippase-like domain-containing protein [Micromonosporaceae bacterium]|nr:flippase-like domain-containing protein [Micromonosporaceae bacterium]